MAHPSQNNDGMSLPTNSLQQSASFFKFGSLPTELRVMIWREATITARLIIIEPKPTASALHSGYLPSLLYVNSESRYIASKYYTSRFTFSFKIVIRSSEGINTSSRPQRRSVIMSTYDILAFYGLLANTEKHDRRHQSMLITGYTAAPGWNRKIKRIAVLSKRVWDDRDRRIVPYLNSGLVDLELGFRMKGTPKAILPIRTSLRQRLLTHAGYWCAERDFRVEGHEQGRLEEDQQVIKSAFTRFKGTFPRRAEVFLGSTSPT